MEGMDFSTYNWRLNALCEEISADNTCIDIYVYIYVLCIPTHRQVL